MSEVNNETNAVYNAGALAQKTEECAIVLHALEIIRGRLLKTGFNASCPADVTNYVRLQVADLEHEVFGVLFMNNQNCLIDSENMFRGTIDSASVYPREVAKRALELNAASIIVYHNHPSGNCDPSDSDKKITKRLSSAMELIDVRLLDHILIGGMNDMSFANKGLL